MYHRHIIYVAHLPKGGTLKVVNMFNETNITQYSSQPIPYLLIFHTLNNSCLQVKLLSTHLFPLPLATCSLFYDFMQKQKEKKTSILHL